MYSDIRINKQGEAVTRRDYPESNQLTCQRQPQPRGHPHMPHTGNRDADERADIPALILKCRIQVSWQYPPANPDQRDEETMTAFAEPRDIVTAFAEALNAKDADRLGSLFSADAEFVNIMGMRMRQRSGIVAGHAWAFSGPLVGSRIEFDNVEELKVTDDVTVLHAHCVRDRLPQAPASTLPSGTSVLVFVTRRGPDGWQAVSATNVTESKPPTA